MADNNEDDLKKFFEKNLKDALAKGEKEFESEKEAEKQRFETEIDKVVNGLPDEAKTMFKTLFAEITGVTNSSSDDSTHFLNIPLALQTAHQILGAEGNAPILADAVDKYRSALKKASLWIDSVTEFSPTTTEMNNAQNIPNAIHFLRPVDWVDESIEFWDSLVKPIASSTTDSLQASMHEQMEEFNELSDGEMPPEMKQMFEINLGNASANIPFIGDEGAFQNAISKVNRTLMTRNIASSVAMFAQKVFTGSTYSIPLFKDQIVVVPQNIASFVKNNSSIDADDIISFLMLKEIASTRLFSAASWIKGHILSLIDSFATGVQFNLHDIQEAVAEIDPHDIDALKSTIESSKLAPKLTDAQKIQVSNLRSFIALIEGWVCYMVIRAGAANLKNVSEIRELMLRELIGSDPAASAFMRLIGIDLSPIEYNKAITFWEKAYLKLGPNDAEKIWKHPDNIPNEDALKTPEGTEEFFNGNAKFIGAKSSIPEIKIEQDWNDLLK